MNLQNTIWTNYGFWFRASLVGVLIWIVISLTTSLVLYFSWPYQIQGLEIIIFKFLTWFFVLPAIALMGLINAVPYISNWLFEDISKEKTNVNQNYTLSKTVAAPNHNSYKNVAAKLKNLYDDDEDEDMF